MTAKDLPEPYWTAEERQLLATHLSVCMRRLVPDPNIKFLLQVVPERDFLTHPDPKMAEYVISVRGGWSIWIRETHNGAPSPYQLYLEWAIKAVAGLVPQDQFLSEVLEAVVTADEPRLPDHQQPSREIRLRTKAIELGILQNDPPAEVASLFERTRLNAWLAAHPKVLKQARKLLREQRP